VQSNYPDSFSVVTFLDCEILSFDADQMICLTGKVKHLIDLRACAEEFLKKHPTSSGRCILPEVQTAARLLPDAVQAVSAFDRKGWIFYC